MLLLQHLKRTAPMLLLLGAVPPVTYVDLATPFERVAIATAQKPEAERIAAVRQALDSLLPGVYREGPAADRRIAKALTEFPSQQIAYDRTVRNFPKDMARAADRFRTVFPGFSPPIPVYLYHSLGSRDGGTDFLEPGHRKVMLFGADVIAKLHADDSLVPFFDHELFHLQNAKTFPDCEQLWCGLWQEGLAVVAASAMTPGATDHQLLLDQPSPIRGQTEARRVDAMCFVAAHFDDAAPSVTAQALQVGGKPPAGLPERFGYYIGYRLVQAIPRSLPRLDELGHEAARTVLRSSLDRALRNAGAHCRK